MEYLFSNLQNLIKKVVHVESNYTRKLEQFHEIHSSLSAFDGRDERLMSPQSFRHLHLKQSSGFTMLPQQLREPHVSS